MSIIKGYEYLENKFPKSRYEDGDIDIEQFYDGIAQAYSNGYKDGVKDERDHFFNVKKSLTKDVMNMTLDKVEEFLNLHLFNSELYENGQFIPDEIIAIKYKTVRELLDAMREDVK